MTEKENRDHSRSGETLVQDSGNTANSNVTSNATALPSHNNAEHPHNDDNAAPETEQLRESQPRGKEKGITEHLQTIGLIAAIVTIPIAYWQGRVQSSYSTFEKNQRVVELSLDLANYWETQLDPDTRYMAGRVIAKLNSFEKDEEKKKALVNALLEPKHLSDSNSVLQNTLLRELIEPDIDYANPAGLKMTPVMAVARYKAAIIRVLNTMEAVVIVREHCKELPEALKVIDKAYSGTIQQRYQDLALFIVEYRKRYIADRDMQAWQPLTEVVEKGDWMLNQSKRK